MDWSFDYALFAHLRPKQRTDDYAARVTRFIAKCPAKTDDMSSPYWNVSRSCRCIDCDAGRMHLLPYRSSEDLYRVQTKTRRAEVRTIVFMLPFIELHGSEELASESQALVQEGEELIAVYDEIIRLCI